jgi:hypothetical protein
MQTRIGWLAVIQYISNRLSLLIHVSALEGIPTICDLDELSLLGLGLALPLPLPLFCRFRRLPDLLPVLAEVSLPLISPSLENDLFLDRLRDGDPPVVVGLPFSDEDA